MTLDEARASEGAAVAYDPDGEYPEVGWITGTTATMALVRYHGQGNVLATRKED